MKITILGCGPSGGVPQIGPYWGRCDPAEPRNRRSRCSLLVESRGQTLLIDTAPDLRMQLLTAGASRIDAVAMTHAHADHLHGIDDIRVINRLMKKALPLYADAATLDEIGKRFGYVFEPPGADGFFSRPALIPHRIAGRFVAAGIPVLPFRQDHGFSRTLGLRIGGFAYSTDVTEFDETAFAALAGIELWIVDCLRRKPHPTHSHLAKTLGWIARMQPRRAILTHMDHDLDYAELVAELPAGVEPGYDGLIVETADP